MSSLFELLVHPGLDEPVLVLGLEGWIDAGLGGATAIDRMTDTTEEREIATFDTDLLVDHQSRRPTMTLQDGVLEELTWPEITLVAASDAEGTDYLVLTGSEPDHRWSAFAGDVTALALELGVRLVVSLGAYPAAVPHTRPARVVATASSQDLVRPFGSVAGRLEVPAGIAAAVQLRCAEAGIPAVGLWAQVPHYAANGAYPAASSALLAAFEQLTDLRVDRESLDESAARTRAHLDKLVANSREHLDLVAQLEQAYDASVTDQAIPSGDDLAAEVERFLRGETD
ncbi:MAG: PAC2 family protein [Actinomycetota bacterium]|nr:PAC2 family protein [Actinomycetota bacterium]